eukprot:270744-Pelagomonas_calceolata.AAC.3
MLGHVLAILTELRQAAPSPAECQAQARQIQPQCHRLPTCYGSPAWACPGGMLCKLAARSAGGSFKDGDWHMSICIPGTRHRGMPSSTPASSKQVPSHVKLQSHVHPYVPSQSQFKQRPIPMLSSLHAWCWFQGKSMAKATEWSQVAGAA